MAFFDELNRKMSEAGLSAAQRSRDASDISRLNNAIAEEERKINNNYFQIGKLYVALHAHDFEDDFAGLVSGVKESEEKIAECRQQIKAVKGIVTCEKCGTDVANTMAFCSACGAQMPKTAYNSIPDGMIKCSRCNAIIPNDVRFCTSCGQPIAPANPVAPVTPVAPAAPANPVAPVMPAAPTAPVAPAMPVEPVTPVAPTVPVEPVAPVVPVEPINSASVEPLTPVDPLSDPQTENTLTPAGSFAPAESLDPVAQESPVEPVQPLIFVNSIESASADIAKVNRCPNCGYENGPEAIFCIECGTKVE